MSLGSFAMSVSSQNPRGRCRHRRVNPPAVRGGRHPKLVLTWQLEVAPNSEQGRHVAFHDAQVPHRNGRSDGSVCLRAFWAVPGGREAHYQLLWPTLWVMLFQHRIPLEIHCTDLFSHGVPSTLIISTSWSIPDSPGNCGCPSTYSAVTQPVNHIYR